MATFSIEDIIFLRYVDFDFRVSGDVCNGDEDGGNSSGSGARADKLVPPEGRSVDGNSSC